MPRHKKWIDKKSSISFRLVPKAQNDVSDENENAGLVCKKKKNKEEELNCGIFFDDDYDYMQHLRSLDEVLVSEHEEIKRSAPKKIPDEITEKETGVEKPHQNPSPDGILDEEIMAALEGSFDFDDPENMLEDDFIIKANGGVLPTLDILMPMETVNEEEEGNATFRVRREIESDDEHEMDGTFDEQQASFFENADNSDEEEEDIGCERKVVSTQLIDKQFDRYCEEYFSSDKDESEASQDEHFLDPNSDRMMELVAQFNNNKPELILEKDEVARRYALIDEEEEASEKMKKIALDDAPQKKAKWDCESALSTYSNIYNHPTLIVDHSRKRKLKPVLKELEKMDETNSIHSRISVSTVRTRGETTEERKARKSVVKEMRAERRAEKKCNKLAFKEERKKLAARHSQPLINAKRIS